MAAVFAAELLVFVVVAGRLGLPVASLIAVVASVVGVRQLFRSAPVAIARSFQDLSDAAGRPATGPSADLAVADRALVVAGALLLAFPGLLTGAIGIVLFVGPVRRLLAPSLGSRLSSLLPAGALGGRSFAHRRDVVDATATVKDPARPPASSADRAQAPTHVHELP
ncbi:MAG: FxsA family protein [Acidimicrobiia bacterium]|nr:FxsA family protein [Acidimicrobiia bacterium]